MNLQDRLNKIKGKYIWFDWCDGKVHLRKDHHNLENGIVEVEEDYIETNDGTVIPFSAIGRIDSDI